jgi:hypothetical protein
MSRMTRPLARRLQLDCNGWEDTCADARIRFYQHWGTMTTQMLNERIDLKTVQRQIRIARLKLGAILEQMDQVEATGPIVEHLNDRAADVMAEIDRMAESIQRFQCR